MRLIEGYRDYIYVVDKINLEDYEIRKLNRLKLEVGSVIKIINKHRGYPFLIEMDGNRIAFSKEVAKAIEVIPYG